jgi:hypothetical protein
MIWWISHVLGLDNASGPWYLFWSGFGADLGLIGGALLLFRRHNCHVKWCPLVGRHKVGEFVVCALHHPKDKPTSDDIEQEARLENLR